MLMGHLSGSDGTGRRWRISGHPTDQPVEQQYSGAGGPGFKNCVLSANRLRDSGKERAKWKAVTSAAALYAHCVNVGGLGAAACGDNAAARAAYDAVLAREPGNVDAMLGRGGNRHAQGDNAAARALNLAALPVAKSPLLTCSAASRWRSSSLAILRMVQRGPLTALRRRQKHSRHQWKAQWWLRDAAAFQAQTGEPVAGAGDLQRGNGRRGDYAGSSSDNDTFTRLTRNDEKDDWLKRGVRSDVRRSWVPVSRIQCHVGARLLGVERGLAVDSDLKAHTTMLQVMRPRPTDGHSSYRYGEYGCFRSLLYGCGRKKIR